MSDESWHVHFAGGQKIKWALDEDLHWARQALGESVRPVSLPVSRIVHAAWWPALLAAGSGSLRGKTVLCFADNPPALYLTQPGFDAAANRVDLWIARSREALGQFQTLGLPAALAPYCADPQIFRPLSDQSAIRLECGLPEGAFVIGNFHRDSEGSDPGRPKAQKGPDIFLEIARELHRRVSRTVVLLAGPRRNWLRRELGKAGVPHCFVGTVRDGDDYEINILDRVRLNRLYQALDVCLVSSRWEGGPYSVLEAVLAGRPVLSTPLGTARDLLPEECLYRSVDEAVSWLEHRANQPDVGRLDSLRLKALDHHTLGALRASLLEVYRVFPTGGAGLAPALASAGRHACHRIRQRLFPAALAPARVTKGGAPAHLLPMETPLAPATDHVALGRSAADIAWFRE